MNDILYEDIPKKNVGKLPHDPLNARNAHSIGIKPATVFLANFNDALNVYDMKAMNNLDLAHYWRQLIQIMEIKIMAIQNNPFKHTPFCIISYKALKTLILSHLEFLLDNYELMDVTSHHDVAKGWSQAALFFCVIMMEMKLLNSMESIMYQLCVLMKLPKDNIPECFKGKGISGRIRRKIVSPKFIHNPSAPDVDCYPKCFLYNPSAHKEVLRNLLVVFDGDYLCELSQLQTYTQWRVFAERAYYMDVVLNAELREYLWNLLGWTAELCSETTLEKSGRLDMSGGYVTKSRYKGIMDEIISGAVQINTETTFEVGIGKDKMNEDGSSERKINNGEEVISCGPYFFSEICEIFAGGMKHKQIFKKCMKQKIHVYRSSDLPLGIVLLKRLLGINANTNDRICIDIFNRGLKALFNEKMNGITEVDFVRNTADMARELLKPSGTSKTFANRNNFLPPRDTSSHEEGWYGFLKFAYVAQYMYSSGLKIFQSSAFHTAVNCLSHMRCFQIELYNFDRDFKWMDICFVNHVHNIQSSIKKAETHKYPIIIQLDDSIWFHTGETIYKCNYLYDAIGLWILYVSTQMKHIIKFDLNESVSFQWLAELYILVAAHIATDPELPKSKVMLAFIEKYTNKSRAILLEERERFKSEL